jgi:Mrp family chromosome partitioning ATPase
MKVQDRKIKESLSLIQHKILVMSGKGGVGKTSVAVNLAVALSQTGKKVGLMDVDLHGPDIPRMLGLKGLLEVSADGRFVPRAYSDSLEIVSIESMTDNVDEAIIWRGPLKMHVIRQFLYDVHWGRLDYLIVDSPPGTGDEPLTVAQTIKGAKAIIVTTPQEISLADVRKAISFCRTMEMPMLGLIENMSGFICPHCGNSVDLFGKGGGLKTALDAGVSLLAEIPFDPRMVSCSDNGKSLLIEEPDSQVAMVYAKVAEMILKQDEQKEQSLRKRPLEINHEEKKLLKLL